MISDRALKVHESTTRLKARRSQYDRTQVWRTHSDALNESAELLEAPRAFLQWLHALGGPAVPAGIAEVSRARSAVARLQEGFANNPDQLLSGDLINRSRAAVKRAAEELERVAAAAWAQYLDQLSPPDADIYAGLRDHPELGGRVREAEQQDRRYSQLRGEPYLKTDALRSEFANLLVARTATRKALPEITDDDVRLFVTSAGRGGAPLSLTLKENVLEWLDQYGLTDTYVVRRKSGG
jgi:hypothetical protein